MLGDGLFWGYTDKTHFSALVRDTTTIYTKHQEDGNTYYCESNRLA